MLDEPHTKAGPVTREDALARAKHWIDRRFREPTSSWERIETRDLATELVVLAVAEAMRSGDTADELDQKLAYCVSLVESLQLAGRSTRIAQAFDLSDDERTEDEKTTVKLYRDLVWRRYNPADGFWLGAESSAYYDGFKDTIANLATRYLAQPWSRHPMVDFVLLDMMTTREACAYGEHLKITGQIGTLQLLGEHFAGGGSLDQMKWTLGLKAASWGFRLLIGWIVPVAAIYLAFHGGYETTGWIFLGLFALSTAWWLLMLVLRFGLRIYWYATGKTDPADRPKEILKAMFRTWTALEGPVINPTVVKEQMVRARDLGAVWDGASWSIIDRAIAIDPAVMITRPRAGG